MTSSTAQLHLPPCPSECRSKVVRRGFFRRFHDRAVIQRYRCSGCKRSYSDATTDPCFRQKRRDLNGTIAHLLTGGFSQRRAARDLRVTRKTIVRKFIFLGLRAVEVLRQTNRQHPPARTWEFDELITSEHTKCKPVSVLLAVETESRRILGFRVGQIPAHGQLASFSRKKYGKRPDERRRMQRELFDELKTLVRHDSVVKSDQSSSYPNAVRKHFPAAVHHRYKGRRGCVTGQGELKRVGKDSIFALNHTFAMLRANVNRLFRRTWCTTKRRERLNLHIALYAARHNLELIVTKIH